MTPAWTTFKPISPTRSVLDYVPRPKPVRVVNGRPVFPIVREANRA